MSETILYEFCSASKGKSSLETKSLCGAEKPNLELTKIVAGFISTEFDLLKNWMVIKPPIVLHETTQRFYNVVSNQKQKKINFPCTANRPQGS